MKWYCAIGFVFFSINTLKAQTAKQFSTSAFITPYKLEVTYNKTTNLIFPGTVVTVDRGSQDILVQKTNGAENILKVKADTKNFAETNLSVITTDGKLYSFLVCYTDQPSYLNIEIGIASHITTEQGKEALNRFADRPDLAVFSMAAFREKRNIHGVNSKNSDVSFSLSGFYVQDSIMFLRLVITNQSQIDYDIDQFRFYIRDKKQSKRTASQEIEIEPLRIFDNTNLIKGNSEQKLIVAVSKFTIPDGKFLAIELTEKNGGRNLFLRIKNKYVMKAMQLASEHKAVE